MGAADRMKKMKEMDGSLDIGCVAVDFKDTVLFGMEAMYRDSEFFVGNMLHVSIEGIAFMIKNPIRPKGLYAKELKNFDEFKSSFTLGCADAKVSEEVCNEIIRQVAQTLRLKINN